MAHDEIWETNLPDNIKEDLSEHGTPLSQYGAKIALEELGWKFAGRSVYSFVRCPSCPQEQETNCARALALLNQ
tara:strand:- start:17 stop:238 length:222 start_codon:yes stop_codon:yes gene_type:complete